MTIELHKTRYPVSEAARLVAQYNHCTFGAARTRLYRAIECGQIRAHKVLGCLMLDADTVKQSIMGDDDYD